MEQKKLDEVLKKHLKWLRSEDGGERANLSSADLRYANLSSADLSYANLSYADLSYANLRSADLSYADLSNSDLSSANLRSADLSYANLSYANLSYANLRSADLSYADLVYFTFNRDTAYFVFDGKIRIGCEYLQINEWIERCEDIGKKNQYTSLEIMAYKNFIELCAKLQKEKDK